MKCKFFVINALLPEEGEVALNQFCGGVKVINVEKHFVPQGENSYWSVCVNYIQSTQANHSNKNLYFCNNPLVNNCTKAAAIPAI